MNPGDLPDEQLKRMAETLSGEKQRLLAARLSAVDLLYGGNSREAWRQIEALVPAVRKLITRLRDVSRQMGIELEDGTWLLRALLSDSLQARARCHEWDGFDATAEEASLLFAEQPDECERMRFTVDLAQARSYRDGLQEWMACLEEACRFFADRADDVAVCGYLLELADLRLWLHDLDKAEDLLGQADALSLQAGASPARTLGEVTAAIGALEAAPAGQLPVLPDMEVLSRLTAGEQAAALDRYRRQANEATEWYQDQQRRLLDEAEGIHRWSIRCDVRYRLVMAQLRLHHLRGRHEKALEASIGMLADPMLQDPEIHRDISFFHQLLAVLVRIKQGQCQEALDDLQQLPGTLTPPQLRFKMLAGAKALLGLGRYPEAYTLLGPVVKQAGVRSTEPPESDDLSLLILWAQAAEGCQALEDATLAWDSVMKRLAGSLRTPLGYRMESTWIASHEQAVTEALRLCVRLQRADLFHRWLEPLKAKGLQAILRTGGTFAAHAEPVLEAAYRKAVRTYECLGEQLDRLDMALWSGRLSSGEAGQTIQERDRLLAERATCVEGIRVYDPRWRQLTLGEPADPTARMPWLRAHGIAVLSLACLGRECLAALTDGTGTLLGSRNLEPVWERLQLYAGNLSAADANPVWYDLSLGLFIQASDLVPAELLERALRAKTLVVCPHRLLHLVPWAALLHRGARLFERVQVSVFPVFPPAVVSETNRDALLFGVPDFSGLAAFSPLPEGQREVDALSRAYREAGRLSGEPVCGRDATAETLVRLLREGGDRNALLHVVCHGTTDPEDPLRAGLVLADSVLDAGEIARLSPCPREVILSACSTGYRPQTAGTLEIASDEVLGLPGAFLEAGALTLLTSIPPAHDSTASLFMQLYHGFRLEGLPPLMAYRKTQLSLLGRGEPVYRWAGFVLYGGEPASPAQWSARRQIRSCT